LSGPQNQHFKDIRALEHCTKHTFLKISYF